MSNSSLHTLIWSVVQKGTLPSDSDNERLRKALLTLMAGIIGFLAIFWGTIYVVSGYPWSGAIPLTYAFVSFTSIVHFFATKRFEFFRFSQFFLIVHLPFLLQWSLGGFANGSAVMIWAFFTPLAALFFQNIQAAFRWIVYFLLLTVVSGVLDVFAPHAVAPMATWLNVVYFVMNMGCGFAVIYIVIHYFVKDREEANSRESRAKEEAVQSKQQLENAYRQLQDNEARIRELMLTDALTGIANRRALDARLREESERVKRYGNSVCVILTDLDFFKRINDNYGHAKGDEVLQVFVQVIRDNIRGIDFAARYGGEEFVIVSPETTCEGALRMADRIRQTLEEKSIEGIKEPITASFGLTKMVSGERCEDTLARADKALYTSKQSGRNRVTSLM